MTTAAIEAAKKLVKQAVAQVVTPLSVRDPGQERDTALLYRQLAEFLEVTARDLRLLEACVEGIADVEAAAFRRALRRAQAASDLEPDGVYVASARVPPSR